MATPMVRHVTWAQRLGPQRIQGDELLPGHLGPRHHQRVRNRWLGLEGTRIGQFVTGIRRRERPPGRRRGGDRQGQRLRTIDRRPWQAKRVRQRLRTLGALLIRRLLEPALAVQRDGAPYRGIGALPPRAGRAVEVLSNEAPPDKDCFASEGGLHLLKAPVDGHPGLAAHWAPLWCSGNGAAALPRAHRPEASGGPGEEPRFQARLARTAMLHGVGAQDPLPPPDLRRRCGLGPRAVVEGGRPCLDGPQGPHVHPALAHARLHALTAGHRAPVQGHHRRAP
jgi:hypothetical protein